MRFFRKSAPQPTPAPEQPADHPITVPAPEKSPADMTPEETARYGYEKRFGAPMPPEVATWIKQLARIEARRNRAAEGRMDRRELEQLKEARRLSETKLENIEQSLLNIRRQQEWFNRFVTLRHKLDSSKSTLYEVNKQLAGVRGEARELERFETFESVQGIFQRIQVLEAEQQHNKEALRQTEQALQTYRNEEKKQSEQSEQALRTRRETEDALDKLQDALAEGYRLKGAESVIQAEQKRLQDMAAGMRQSLFAIEKEAQETDDELERISNALSRKRQQLQEMEAQQRLLTQGDVVLVKLDQLFELKTIRRQTQYELDDILKKQNDQNEQLNRLFLQHQELEESIHVLQNELHVHRESNRGLTGYSLQKRAMQLENRRQRLQSAGLLWKRISAGYEFIDECAQAVVRLQIHVENDDAALRKLEQEVNALQMSCEEMKYAYTLSKSQNVIQLRSDLREGVNCSVCGATHHPYHSDTMLEQSKLITELKTEYELAEAERIKKERMLADMKQTHAAEKARLEEQRSLLVLTKETHDVNVNEWNLYKDLDPSFADCSPSTNKEARKLMLQQLIEKTGLDAEAAQKELDTYNYHQTLINNINEKIEKYENDKSNIIVRLNEVNTGCQVMANGVERIQQYYTAVNRRYTQLYDELDRILTPSNWRNEWETSHENLKMNIRKRTDLWQRLHREIATEEAHMKQKDAEHDNLLKRLNELKGNVEKLDQYLENTDEELKDQNNAYRKLFGEKEVKKVYQQARQNTGKTRNDEEEQRKTADEARAALQRQEGKWAFLLDRSRQLEEMLATEREALDLWMRRYNATHSPVQLAELERVFSSDRDWTPLRERVRRLEQEATLAQSKVESIRAELTAHQADGMRPENNEEETRENLQQRLISLEQKRRDISAQIAAYDVQLQAQEKYREQEELSMQDLNRLLNL